MNKVYRKKNRKNYRITAVRVYLSSDQIAVLLNHGLYRGASRGLSVEDEAQFVVDWFCSESLSEDYAQNLRDMGVVPMAFDMKRLPPP